MRAKRLSLVACACSLCLSLSVVPAILAHPVPQKNHDRTIVVRLKRDAVIVRYRLEVDKVTAVWQDLPALGDRIDLAKLKKEEEWYTAFTKAYAPILAANLVGSLDRKSLEFKCTDDKYSLNDENKKPLGHLRCDFVFRAEWKPAEGRPHEFAFRAGNYAFEEGLILLSLEIDSAITIISKTEPDEALKSKVPTELKPGDDDKLRQAAATLVIAATT